jgi:hypothetical protein
MPAPSASIPAEKLRLSVAPMMDWIHKITLLI